MVSNEAQYFFLLLRFHPKCNPVFGVVMGYVKDRYAMKRNDSSTVLEINPRLIIA